MVQDVYIDILFLINFSMDYLCIYICSKILHRKMKLWRMITASVIGGIYSIISLFLPFSSVGVLIADALVCILMCIIVYYEKQRGISSLLLSAFLFVGISMMTGGCMTAVFNLLNKLDLPLGSVESDSISTYLFALLAAIGGIISLKSGQIISRRSSIKECRLHVKFCGQDFEFLGFSDSGNLVRDPISGKAVIFVERRIIEEKLSLSFLDSFENGRLDPDSPCKNLRLIYLRTAAGTSVSVAAMPDKATIEFEDKGKKNIVFALDALISPSDIGGSAGGYTAIIPAEIIKR